MRLGALVLVAGCWLAPSLAGAEGDAKKDDAGEETGSEVRSEGASDESWCAPELTALEHSVCAALPAREADGPRTLVIFLHGVILPGSGWQWNQQRGAARVASAHGVTALMPRGRRGHGPKGMSDWWTWPGSATAQAKFESEVIAEWAQARAALEEKTGKKFERVWVFGFSNGAYYAESLALRGRLGAGAPIQADGFAVFAGGSAPAYQSRVAKQNKARAPIFVGWGGRDKDHPNQQKLAKMLRDLRWPSRSEGAPKAGHVMTDHQARSAVNFLREKR